MGPISEWPDPGRAAGMQFVANANPVIALSRLPGASFLTSVCEMGLFFVQSSPGLPVTYADWGRRWNAGIGTLPATLSASSDTGRHKIAFIISVLRFPFLHFASAKPKPFGSLECFSEIRADVYAAAAPTGRCSTSQLPVAPMSPGCRRCCYCHRGPPAKTRIGARNSAGD